MMFNVGDQVIYPNQGVALIEEICSSSVGGGIAQFYRLRLVSNNSLVMIPVDNAETIGVRRLSNAEELNDLFGILENDSVVSPRDWKNRYRDNLEKMMTGSIFDVARVLKNLHFLSCQKPLSFREKKMHDRARQLVIAEIATVQDKQVGDVETLLDGILSEAYDRSMQLEPV